MENDSQWFFARFLRSGGFEYNAIVMETAVGYKDLAEE